MISADEVLREHPQPRSYGHVPRSHHGTCRPGTGNDQHLGSHSQPFLVGKAQKGSRVFSANCFFSQWMVFHSLKSYRLHF